MLNYKEGDWVVDINRRNPPFQLLIPDHFKDDPDYLLVEAGSYIDLDCIPWKPEIDDLIVNYSFCEHSLFSVFQVRQVHVNEITTVAGWIMDIKNIEPYLGPLPSILKIK